MTTVNSVDSSNSTTQQSTTSTLAPQQLGESDFLKLLVTQMQNQDPMSPTDDKEFIAQMAQFSSLQEMQTLNANFTNFEETQSQSAASNALNNAVQFLGRQVTYTSTDGATTSTGIVNAVSPDTTNGVIFTLDNGEKIALSAITKIEK